MYRRAEHTCVRTGVNGCADPTLSEGFAYANKARLRRACAQVPVAKSKRKRNRRTLATASSTPTLPGASNVHD